MPADSLDFIKSPSSPPAQALISEAHHQVANDLSVIAGLVRMQLKGVAKRTGSIPVEEVRQLLEEVVVRIDSVGRLHRCLADVDGLATVELSNYLREISNSLAVTLFATGESQLTFAAPDPCVVPGRDALAIGLLVTELLTNAIKYSHPTGLPGIFVVSCSQADEVLAIEVADDGVGLPEDFDPMRDGGLGLRLVRLLARQLGAELTFDDAGIGLRVGLRMRIAARRNGIPHAPAEAVGEVA